MRDDELREVLEQIMQAINDLRAAKIAIPPSLNKAAAALINELNLKDLPVTRPMGQS